MSPLCGKPLSHEDRKVWLQAVAMLMGLKTRNGFAAKDLTAAVGKALQRGAATDRQCEDCRAKVASGDVSSGRPRGRSGPLGLAPPGDS
jgi:hypothetical protein